MSAEAEAIFYGLALVCFALAAVTVKLHPRLNMIALGLALWVFVLFYAACEAADF